MSREVWPFPFAGGNAARISRRGWLLLTLLFAAIHWLWLAVSTVTGNFDPAPNHDHVHVMRDVLETGSPGLAVWPPGYGYWMALTALVTAALNLAFWTGKVFLDVVPVVASGVLTVALGMRLTRNRGLAVAAGVGGAITPLFGMASPEGLAVVVFQPLFLGALLVFVVALQRSGFSFGLFMGSGALLGAACLVRANPQFLPLALAPVAVLVFWRRDRRPIVRTVMALAVLLLAEALVLLPWSLHQHQLGESGVVAAPVVWYAFFDGMRRHEGFEVGDALRYDPDPPPHSLAGAVEFHREWIERDPTALAKIYGVKFLRAWYLSDSGRWDRIIVLTHAPYWILGTIGVVIWFRRHPLDPGVLLVLLVIVYMWTVSALVSGLARYSIPLYGFIALLAAIGAVGCWSGARRLLHRGA